MALAAAPVLFNDPGASPGDRRAVIDGPRFLLYSHDGVGLGHIRRNLTLAAALNKAQPASSVLVVTGAEELETFSIPASADVLRLPGMCKLDNAHYAARRLSVSDKEIRDLRAALLTAVVASYQPDVVLADKHPGGAEGELIPALEQHKAAGGRGALGLRDVLDDPAKTRREWLASGSFEHLAAFHDLVLVYGQADLLDPLSGCGLSPSLRGRVRSCGYVAAGSSAAPTGGKPPARSRPLVVAMAGGGEDGAPLLRAALRAAAGSSWDLLAVSGPHSAPEQAAELGRLAELAGARLVPSVRDLGRRLTEADAVVCMGGYNSLVEVLSAAVPTVCVPRVSPRIEQKLRAQAFAAHGLLRVLEPEELDSGRLGAEVERALATDRRRLAERIRRVVDLGGAARAAEVLLDLAGTASVHRNSRQVARAGVRS